MNEHALSLIIGVVAGVLSALILKYLPAIKDFFKNIKLIKGFQIEGSRITGIWKDRHEKDAIKNIKEELKKANGEILMAGVAFPDFFRPNATYRQEIQALLKNPSFTFRILLLDPDKTHAKERADIEKARFTIMDIESTIEYLKSINTQSNIIAHIYDFPPMAFLIITNECIFIEQYHFGTPRADLGCTGGQTPLLRLDRNSVTYKVMKEHFEYIWTKKSNEIINRLR